MSPPIICTGFHRSGTSLTAQILQMAGATVALELMPAGISNPDGHFEDMLAMRMHDRLLAGQDVDWQFHDQAELQFDDMAVAQILAYIQRRDEHTPGLWAVKDPRACLLLPQWQQALAGRGCFMLLFRHWGLCIESLLQRHARVLAHNLPGGKAFDESLAFWSNPELAARMWLAYNKRLIAFVEENPDSCLLVPNDALLQGFDVVHAINNKFSAGLKSVAQTPVKEQYSRSLIDRLAVAQLPNALIDELDSVYRQLCSLGCTQSDCIPEITDKPVDAALRQVLIDCMMATQAEEEHSPSSVQQAESAEQLDKFAYQELLEKLTQGKALWTEQNIQDTFAKIQRLATLQPDNWRSHEWLGRYHQSLQNWEQAHKHYTYAVEQPKTPPYLLMLLADVYCNMDALAEAESLYRKAIERNPNNAMFALKLARLLKRAGRYDDAFSYYQQAQTLRPKLDCYAELVDLKRLTEGEGSALELAKSCYREHPSPALAHHIHALLLVQDSEKAQSFYKNTVRERLDKKRFFNLLGKIANCELTDKAKISLASYMLSHLLEIFSFKEFVECYIEPAKPYTSEKKPEPKLSLVVIAYNMARELPRTLTSLLPPYQQYIDDKDVEIIVIDNGSDEKADFAKLAAGVRYITYPSPTPSPAAAINFGIRLANANFIGVLIDGARMASPGLCHFALKAAKISERVIVSTPGYHLGPEVQMQSVQKGYNQSVEDKLLDSVEWQKKGYGLFAISALAGSSSDGFFQPIAESNALFMARNLWDEIGGYDEGFVSPGGGLVNLDTYKRACDLPDAELVLLVSEGTFHQVHGGIATNQKREDASWKVFHDEYMNLRKSNFKRPTKLPIYLGNYQKETKPFWEYSAENMPHNKLDEETVKQNLILSQYTYCKLYQSEYQDNIADKLLDRPVIITGRGGSGTRLLSKLMQGIDIFIGNEINETEDSIEWVGPIYDLVENSISLEKGTFSQKHIDRLRYNARNILLKNNPEFTGIWGWKLPETMLCVPEMLRTFPEMKLIHLVRNPVDLSLRRTHITSRYNNKIGKAVLSEAYKQLDLNIPTVSEKDDYFNNAVSWNYQVKKVVAFAESNLLKHQYLMVHYEDIINDPSAVLKKICEFIDVELTQVPELNIDIGRAKQYSNDDHRVAEVLSLCGDTAKRIGYKI